MTHGRRPGGSGDRGQASVELALCLPLLVGALLLVVQVGLVVADQVRVVHAAREAARAAAVDPSTTDARTAALDAAGLDGGRTQVRIVARGAVGEHVTVEVRHRAVTDVPLVGPLVPEPTLTARATMRVEN